MQQDQARRHWLPLTRLRRHRLRDHWRLRLLGLFIPEIKLLFIEAFSHFSSCLGAQRVDLVGEVYRVDVGRLQDLVLNVVFGVERLFVSSVSFYGQLVSNVAQA